MLWNSICISINTREQKVNKEYTSSLFLFKGFSRSFESFNLSLLALYNPFKDQNWRKPDILNVSLRIVVTTYTV